MNSIKLDFVPYQTALDMKLIGFDEPCFGSINKTSNSAYIPSKGGVFINSSFKNDYTIPCAMYSQAFRFFRKKYNLSSWIYNSDITKFFYTILQNGRIIKANNPYKSYEETEFECLKQLIEIVKNKTNE